MILFLPPHKAPMHVWVCARMCVCACLCTQYRDWEVEVMDYLINSSRKSPNSCNCLRVTFYVPRALGSKFGKVENGNQGIFRSIIPDGDPGTAISGPSSISMPGPV